MHSLADRREFFDDFVPRWILDTEERGRRLQSIFSKYELPLAAPVLDVGGGAGILLPFLRRYSSDHTRIIELEISAEMLRMATALHGADSSSSFVRADGERLPFADGMFGAVHCFSVFPHFQKKEQALGEFHRCLRRGGGISILHLMGHEELNAVHRDAGRVVAEDILPPVEILAETIRASGFTVARAEERSDLYLLTATKP